MATKSIPSGTLCIFSNGIWKALKDTVGHGDVFRNAEFRKSFVSAKADFKPFQFKGRTFRVQKPYIQKVQHAGV